VLKNVNVGSLQKIRTSEKPNLTYFDGLMHADVMMGKENSHDCSKKTRFIYGFIGITSILLTF
jgi:hypothetical protein